LYAQVSASVRADAAAGRIGVGDRLPAARDVASALGINVHTVLHAYQDLRDEGLIVLRRGRGAVVTEAATGLRALRHDLIALTARARAFGLSADALAALVRETASENDPGPDGPAAADHAEDERTTP
jgi:GntR family transcriptional regulator